MLKTLALKQMEIAMPDRSSGAANCKVRVTPRRLNRERSTMTR